MPLAEKLGRMQPSPVDYNLDLKGLEGGESRRLECNRRGQRRAI